MQFRSTLSAMEMTMNVSNLRITVIRSVLATFFLFLHLHCGNSSAACSRLGFDRNNFQGVFGCYYLVAETGGFVGGIHHAHDDHACIVLTPDSLFNQYLSDTLYRSTKFVLSWRVERDSRRWAQISFDNGTDPGRLAASWSNDSLWVGAAGPIMDAISFLYVRCSH